MQPDLTGHFSIHDDFPGTTLDTTLWEPATVVGSGQSVAVAGSNLTLTSGTTVNASTRLRTKRSFKGAITLEVAMLLSQRIANQTFSLRLSNADRSSFVEASFSGLNATDWTTSCQSGGTAGVSSTQNNAQSTAALAIFGIMRHGNEFIFFDRPVNAPTAPIVRAIRNIRVPFIDEPLFLEIIIANGGSAPASTTTWTIDSVVCEEEAEVNVVLRRSLGLNNASEALSTSMVWGNLAGAIAELIAEVPSAARTTSGNSAPIVANLGASIGAVLNVTASSGTSPTLDLRLEESLDNGTTWDAIWHAPRRTGNGTTTIPAIPVGGRRRWAWTIGGTSPSFTFSIQTMASGTLFPVWRQFFDRTANVLNGTLSTPTATYRCDGGTTITAKVTIGTATTPASYQIQISDDGTNWASVGTATAAVASSTVAFSVTGVVAGFMRLIVTAAATAQVGTVVSLSAE